MLAVTLEQEKAEDPNQAVLNKLKTFESHFGTLKAEIAEIKEILQKQQAAAPAVIAITAAPATQTLTSPKNEPAGDNEEEEEEEDK